MSKVPALARCSADFQTHLERRFTPGRIRESTIRQVWKPTLLYYRVRSGKTSEPNPFIRSLLLSYFAFPRALAMLSLQTLQPADPGKEKQKCYDYRCGVLDLS